MQAADRHLENSRSQLQRPLEPDPANFELPHTMLGEAYEQGCAGRNAIGLGWTHTASEVAGHDRQTVIPHEVMAWLKKVRYCPHGTVGLLGAEEPRGNRRVTQILQQLAHTLPQENYAPKQTKASAVPTQGSHNLGRKLPQPRPKYAFSRLPHNIESGPRCPTSIKSKRLETTDTFSKEHQRRCHIPVSKEPEQEQEQELELELKLKLKQEHKLDEGAERLQAYLKRDIEIG
jgi:hypothetical protein